MTRRDELTAMLTKLLGIAEDGPNNISSYAAQNLADAAEAIARALDHAVDANEIAELAAQR